MREKLKYWWTLFYLPIYMICFTYLEKRPVDVNIISIPFDHIIPFIEAFIIPYLLWFPYMGAAFVGLFFYNKKEYARMAAFLMTGMTIFLIVSYVYPNGLDLRPDVMPKDNVFTRLISNLYSTDTSTNVLPSLHVFNSIGAAIALWRTGRIITNNHKSKVNILGISAVVLSSLIVLSTMFIKQHSVVDVISAFAMAIVLYIPVYYLPQGIW